MTKAEVYATVAAVLTTLLEVHPDGAPETSIYMALGCDMAKYEAIRNLLVGSGLIEVKHNLVSLTDKGMETARECNEVLVAK